ncbi:hypothetical protein GCM10008940_00520 [Microbulbifer agarilyticus]
MCNGCATKVAASHALQTLGLGRRPEATPNILSPLAPTVYPFLVKGSALVGAAIVVSALHGGNVTFVKCSIVGITFLAFHRRNTSF